MAKTASKARITTKLKTRAYDTAVYLRDEQDMTAYLDAALIEGNAAGAIAAINAVVRAYAMMQLARDTGLGRESLYKALSSDGNSEFSTVLKVLAALNIKLHASAA